MPIQVMFKSIVAPDDDYQYVITDQKSSLSLTYEEVEATGRTVGHVTISFGSREEMKAVAQQMLKVATG